MEGSYKFGAFIHSVTVMQKLTLSHLTIMSKYVIICDQKPWYQTQAKN